MNRAVLPYMRAQKSGMIGHMGTVGSWYSGANAGFYCATKWALAAISMALREEVAHLGIQVVCIDPGYFRTNFLGGNAKMTAKKVIEDIKPATEPVKQALVAYNGKQPGDPVLGSKLIVEALTGSERFEGKTLPARLLVGEDSNNIVKGALEGYRKDVDAWSELTSSTNFQE